MSYKSPTAEVILHTDVRSVNKVNKSLCRRYNIQIVECCAVINVNVNVNVSFYYLFSNDGMDTRSLIGQLGYIKWLLFRDIDFHLLTYLFKLVE